METRKILGINALVCLVAVGYAVASADAQTTAPEGFMDSATSAGLRAPALGRRDSDVPPRSGNLQVPIALLHPGSARDERQRLRRDGLRPPGRLLLLEQHQQPCRQRHDVDFSGPRAAARRRRTHALQLQQAHGSGSQRGPAFPGDSPFSWATGEGWYFSAKQPTTLYVNVPAAPRSSAMTSSATR